MAMNLDAISNYLAEKEKKTQGVTQNQGQVSPEGTEGAPSAMPGATQSDTPNTSVQATPVTPLSSSTGSRTGFSIVATSGMTVFGI